MLLDRLSRRERQIIDALYALGEGGAREIAAAMKEPGSLDTVRVTLGVLERKGHVRHRVDGRRHLYAPVLSAERARQSALKRITKTFFGGSSSRALLALLDMSEDKLDDRDLKALSQWVAKRSPRRRPQR